MKSSHVLDYLCLADQLEYQEALDTLNDRSIEALGGPAITKALALKAKWRLEARAENNKNGVSE